VTVDNLRDFCLKQIEIKSTNIKPRTYLEVLFGDIVQSYEEGIPREIAWESLSQDYFNTIEEKYYIQESLKILKLLKYKYEAPRFVTYAERNLLPKDINPLSHEYMSHLSQGLTECMTWKGKPIYKTAYDLPIYNMLLWELKPKTIIELGSGGSTEYIKDMMDTFKLDAKIISMDIKNYNEAVDNITYLNIDSHDINTIKKHEHLFNNIQHPLLIIEDIHYNIKPVLDYFYSYTKQGDYFYIEDLPGIKQMDYENWILNKKLLVDTKYTDYFGINTGCAKNAILKRI
jgi:cephalosporin hydroxylase